VFILRLQYVEKSIDDESLQRHDPKYKLLSIEQERADVRIRSLEKQVGDEHYCGLVAYIAF